MIVTRGLTAGGMERTSVNLATYFLSRNYRVVYFTLFRTPHFFTLDSEIEIVEPAIDRERYNKFMYAFKLIPTIRKIIKARKIDYVLGIGEYFNPFVLLATFGLSCKVFVSDRLSPDIKLGLVDIFKKISYPFADGAISQTQYAAKKLKLNTKLKNVIVIPNPLKPITKVEVPIKKQIVSVGRLNREKGHRILIEAFAKIDNKDWILMLIGDGVERNNLEELVGILNINNRVIFAGELADFSKELSESQIFVLPSLSEGFPNALIEAMSVPLACISSDCIAGPSDIIRDGFNGVLVKPNNVDALTSKINALIDDEVLRNQLKDNAFRIIQDLEFNSIAQRYLDFITK